MGVLLGKSDSRAILTGAPYAEMFWVMTPIGVVTVIVSILRGSLDISMRYPGGRKVLKPWIK